MWSANFNMGPSDHQHQVAPPRLRHAHSSLSSSFELHHQTLANQKLLIANAGTTTNHNLSSSSNLANNPNLIKSGPNSSNGLSVGGGVGGVQRGHQRRQSVARILPDISKLRLLSWLLEASSEMINCDIAIMDGVYAKLNHSQESLLFWQPPPQPINTNNQSINYQSSFSSLKSTSSSSSNHHDQSNHMLMSQSAQSVASNSSSASLRTLLAHEHECSLNPLYSSFSIKRGPSSSSYSSSMEVSSKQSSNLNQTTIQPVAQFENLSLCSSEAQHQQTTIMMANNQQEEIETNEKVPSSSSKLKKLSKKQMKQEQKEKQQQKQKQKEQQQRDKLSLSISGEQQQQEIASSSLATNVDNLHNSSHIGLSSSSSTSSSNESNSSASSTSSFAISNHGSSSASRSSRSGSSGGEESSMGSTPTSASPPTIYDDSSLAELQIVSSEYSITDSSVSSSSAHSPSSPAAPTTTATTTTIATTKAINVEQHNIHENNRLKDDYDDHNHLHNHHNQRKSSSLLRNQRLFTMAAVAAAAVTSSDVGSIITSNTNTNTNTNNTNNINNSTIEKSNEESMIERRNVGKSASFDATTTNKYETDAQAFVIGCHDPAEDQGFEEEDFCYEEEHNQTPIIVPEVSTISDVGGGGLINSSSACGSLRDLGSLHNTQKLSMMMHQHHHYQSTTSLSLSTVSQGAASQHSAPSHLPSSFNQQQQDQLSEKSCQCYKNVRLSRLSKPRSSSFRLASQFDEKSNGREKRQQQHYQQQQQQQQHKPVTSTPMTAANLSDIIRQVVMDHSKLIRLLQSIINRYDTDKMIMMAANGGNFQPTNSTGNVSNENNENNQPHQVQHHHKFDIGAALASLDDCTCMCHHQLLSSHPNQQPPASTEPIQIHQHQHQHNEHNHHHCGSESPLGSRGSPNGTHSDLQFCDVSSTSTAANCCLEHNHQNNVTQSVNLGASNNNNKPVKRPKRFKSKSKKAQEAAANLAASCLIETRWCENCSENHFEAWFESVNHLTNGNHSSSTNIASTLSSPSSNIADSLSRYHHPQQQHQQQQQQQMNVAQKNANLIKLFQQEVRATLMKSIELIDLIRRQIKSPESIKQRHLLRCFANSIHLLTSVGCYVMPSNDVYNHFQQVITSQQHQTGGSTGSPGDTRNQEHQNNGLFRLPASDFDYSTAFNSNLSSHPLSHSTSPIGFSISTGDHHQFMRSNDSQQQQQIWRDRQHSNSMRTTTTTTNTNQRHQTNQSSAQTRYATNNNYNFLSSSSFVSSPSGHPLNNSNHHDHQNHNQRNHHYNYNQNHNHNHNHNQNNGNNNFSSAFSTANTNSVATLLTSGYCSSILSAPSSSQIMSPNTLSHHHHHHKQQQQPLYSIPAAMLLLHQSSCSTSCSSSPSSSPSSINSSSYTSASELFGQQHHHQQQQYQPYYNNHHHHLSSNNNNNNNNNASASSSCRSSATFAGIGTNYPGLGHYQHHHSATIGSLASSSSTNSSSNQCDIGSTGLLFSQQSEGNNGHNNSGLKFWQSPKFNFIRKIWHVRRQRLMRQQSKDRKMYNNKIQNKLKLVIGDYVHFHKSQTLLNTENGINSLCTSMKNALEFGLYLSQKLY